MSKPVIKHLLEIIIINRFLSVILFTSVSIFASEISFPNHNVFIAGEGNIDFQLELRLSEGDTLDQGLVYSIDLQSLGIISLTGVESLDIGNPSGLNANSLTFVPSSTIEGPALLDTIIIQANTAGGGGSSTIINFSGPNIASSSTDEFIELHTLGVQISTERMVVGQTDYDAVEITLTDEDGVGIFTDERSFTLGLTDGMSVDLSSDPAPGIDFSRSGFTYTLNRDISSSSIVLSSGGPDSTLAIKPSGGQNRGSGHWQISTNNLTLTPGESVSVGSPSLSLESESALICGSDSVDVSFLIQDDLTYPSLDSGDVIEVILPVTPPWQWVGNTRTASFTMGTGSSLPVTPVIIAVGDVSYLDQALTMNVGGVNPPTATMLSSGHLDFTVSSERMVKGQEIFDKVTLSLSDRDEVGLFTDERSFSIHSTANDLDLAFNESAPDVALTDVSFDAFSHIISIDSDLSDVYELDVSTDLNPSIQVRPAGSETGGLSSWSLTSTQSDIGGWTEPSLSALSAGLPTLVNTGESVLICNDEHVALSFSLNDDPTNLALEDGDEIKLVFPDDIVGWSWLSTGGDSLSETYSSDPLTFEDSLTAVLDDSSSHIEMLLVVNDDAANPIATDVILKAGHLVFEISEERMVVGQTDYDGITLTLRDIDQVGLFTGGRGFSLTAEEDSVALLFSTGAAPIGVNFDTESGTFTINAGLNPTAPLFVSTGSGHIKVNPDPLQEEVATHWKLGLSGIGSVLGSEISIGRPGLRITSNPVLLSENSEEVITVALDYGGEYQALDGTEDLYLRLDHAFIYWADTESEPSILIENLSENDTTLTVDLSGINTSVDSIPILIEVNGTTVNPGTYLKAGMFGVEISQERLIVGQQTDTLDVIFQDVDGMGIFDGDSTQYFMVLPATLTAQPLPGGGLDSISGDTLYYTNTTHEVSDIIFQVLLSDIETELSPTSSNYGFFSTAKSRRDIASTDSTIQVGNLGLSFNMPDPVSNRVLISGNPDTVYTNFSLYQNNTSSIQNFGENDSIRLRIPETLGLKWAEWNTEANLKEDWIADPSYSSDSTRISFLVTGPVPDFLESQTIDFRIGLYGMSGVNVEGDDITLSCRAGSWHDSTDNVIKIEALELDLPRSLRVWNRQGHSDSLNISINSTINIDSLNNGRPFFISLEGIYDSTYLSHRAPTEDTYMDAQGKRFIKLTGLNETVDIGGLIELNPIVGETLIPRGLELRAFDPVAYPNHEPNSVTETTIQVGSPVFLNTDTTDVFVVNNQPHVSVFNFIVEESEGTRTTDIEEDIKIFIPSALGTIESAFIEANGEENFIEGDISGETVTFNVQEQDTVHLSSFEFRLYLSHLNHNSDQIDSLQWSFDGGRTWVNDGTPKLYLDQIEFALAGEDSLAEANRRFVLGSTKQSSLPRFVLRDIDRLTAPADSISLTFDHLFWDSTSIHGKQFVVTTDSITVEGFGMIDPQTESATWVDVSLHFNETGDFAWTLDSIASIGDPRASFNLESPGRLTFPRVDDNSAHEHSWAIPEIVISDTGATRGWRPNSTIRLSVAEIPLSFTDILPQVLPLNDSITTTIEDSILSIHIGGINPPSQITLSGLEFQNFTSTVAQDFIPVSYDEYANDARLYSYSNLIPQHISIADPQFSFYSAGWQDQVIVPGYAMHLDSVRFMETSQASLLFNSFDTVNLRVEEFFDENYGWDTLSTDVFFPDISIEDQRFGEYRMTLSLNGMPIRESGELILVTDAVMTSSADHATNGYHIYYDQRAGIAEAYSVETVLPTILLNQTNYLGLNESNPTLYIKLPESEAIAWADNSDLSDWEAVILDTNNNILSLTSDTPESIGREVQIEGLKVSIGEGYLEPDSIRFSLLPARRTDGELLFHLVDTTASLTVVDLNARYMAGLSTVDTSIFVVGDPEIDTLELKFSYDSNLESIPLFDQPDKVWQVETDQVGIEIDSILLTDVSHNRVLTPIQVLDTSTFAQATIQIPTAYQGDHRILVDWEYAVGKPHIQSLETQFISVDNIGEYHWLESIEVHGDDLGTLCPGRRNAVHVIIPDEVNFIFPIYFGGVHSSDPNKITPVWSTSENGKELIFPVIDTLSVDDVLTLSNIPIQRTASAQDTGFRLRFGLEDNLYNEWAGVNNSLPGYFEDEQEIIFGNITALAFIDGTAGSQLSHIRNSTRMLRVDSLKIDWPAAIQVDSIEFILPQNLQAKFGHNRGSILRVEVDPFVNSVSYSDEIRIGHPSGHEHFPAQGQFPIRMRLHKNDGGVILTDGLSLRIAAPSFRIEYSDTLKNYELRLVDRPIEHVILIIEDDELYPIFSDTGTGRIDSFSLDWNSHFEWSGIPVGNGVSINVLNDSIWHLTVTPDADSVFEISGISLTPRSTLTERSKNPFLNVRDSKIDLENTFIVGAPIIGTIDTILNGAYDQLMDFPGLIFTEDDAVNISQYLPSQNIELRIISSPDIVWAENGYQSIFTHLESINSGDSIKLFQHLKIDHREGIESSLPQISIEVSLPDLELGVLDTIVCTIEYPDVPAEPHFTGDSLLLPLYSGEILSQAFLVNSDNLDTFRVDLATSAVIHDQYETELPGSQNIDTITFPSAALIKLDSPSFNWISDQMSRGDSIIVAGLIGSSATREGDRPFTIPINTYPFKSFDSSNQKHVFKYWPAGEWLAAQALDSVRWSLYTAQDSIVELASGIVDSLIFPTFSAEEGMIYYLEYSPGDTAGSGLRYTLPLLVDSIPPVTTSRWPLPGDTSTDPGIQPHPISTEEVLYAQYFENLIASNEQTNELFYWDSIGDLNVDTLVLIDGFEHSAWSKNSIQRSYRVGADKDTTILSELVSVEELDLSLGETVDRLRRGNLVSIDSMLNILESIEGSPEMIQLVTTLVDMAGNVYQDTLTFPIIQADGGPVYDHFFNYPNPLNPRSGESTHFSFLLKEESTEVSMIILDASGSMVRRFSQQDLPAGRHEIEWDGRNMWGELCATGVYFTILDVADEPQVYAKTLVVNK